MWNFSVFVSYSLHHRYETREYVGPITNKTESDFRKIFCHVHLNLQIGFRGENLDPEAGLLGLKIS